MSMLPTEASLKKLKVTELRERLAAESLETSGLKDDLIKRLLEHFETKEDGEPTATEAPKSGEETVAGEPAPAAVTGSTDATEPVGAADAGPPAAGTSEQDKAKARAERFGIPEKEQAPAKAQGKEQPKKKAGISGLGDVDRKEEFERRKKRAERFGLPVPIDKEEELEKKKMRAERFGLPAAPASALEVAAKLKAREERFGQQ